MIWQAYGVCPLPSLNLAGGECLAPHVVVWLAGVSPDDNKSHFDRGMANADDAENVPREQL